MTDSTVIDTPVDPPESNFVAMLDLMIAREHVDPEFARRLRAVREYIGAPDESSPFLTVVVRTQGKRLESLKDALLCLSAQTDQDFEVVLVAHNALPEGLEGVGSILERQPNGFRERVRLIEVSGGTRSRPLNVGVEAANGRYLAFYDDDDLLFAHWVEEFHTAARTHEGRLMRSTVANQSVEPEVWSGGQAGFRSTSWPKAEHAQHFDQLKHMLVNHSPFMTFAFPATLFTRYGMRFDEDLEVAEDWDMVLRGSLTAGVTEIASLTATYRRWSGGESSYTAHTRERWLASEQLVIDKIEHAVFMLPPGSMKAIREIVLFNEALEGFRFLFAGNQLRRSVRWMWRIVGPAVHYAATARNRLRRMLGRTRRRG
ncbi:glycosyltransferase family 2 protein [Ruicaihuangia caeni]|uniref:glycosyltransferase family 2 protein n=1 Tax=Ruicaihuangia caeni TaxID=3042517 RepID=UPI00338EA369